MLKIISGGQTGADRAALDFAMQHGYPCGGWCPRGRTAEDGPLDPKYPLMETESEGYRQRTKRNIADSDGTMILNMGELSGGSHATRVMAERLGKPIVTIQLDESPSSPDVELAKTWIKLHQVAVLNVAGPREGKCPGVYSRSLLFLAQVLGDAPPRRPSRRAKRPTQADPARR